MEPDERIHSSKGCVPSLLTWHDRRRPIDLSYMQYLAIWWWNGHTINAVTQAGRLLLLLAWKLSVAAVISLQPSISFFRGVRVSRESDNWPMATEKKHEATGSVYVRREFPLSRNGSFLPCSLDSALSPLTVRTEAKCRRWSGCRFESRTRTRTPFMGA